MTGESRSGAAPEVSDAGQRMRAPSKIRHDWPAINHTLLSPSGRVSKRARKAAEAIEYARLFPPGYFDLSEKSDAEKAQDRRMSLLRSAANLRDLAARGMSVRKFTRAAERLEAEANAGSCPDGTASAPAQANAVAHHAVREGEAP